jgi:putative ABC transport system permease protein
MFLHYLKIITRHLLRNKWLSFLKLFSLTLGLCAFIIVMVINYSERTWDHHWEDAGSIYVLKNDFGIGGSQKFSEFLKFNLLQDELVSGIYSRVAHPTNMEKPEGNSATYMMGITDENFFQIFNTQVIAGNLTDFSNSPDAIVITKGLSENLFGREPAIGKTLGIPANEASQDDHTQSTSPFKLFKVVAVIENPSPRSEIAMQAYIKFSPSGENSSINILLDTKTFIKIKKGITKADYQKHINNMFYSHYGALHSATITLSKSELQKHKPELLSITDIHLDKDLNRGKSTALWILYLIAAAVLLVSLVNYINMVISSQLHRQKEIALYRLTGSSYTNLFFLFLSETLIFLIAGLGITLAIIQPAMPWLFKILSIPSDFNIKHLGELWVYLSSLLVITSLVLAVFPLFSIKNTMPARILSANQYTERKDTRILRYGFLCFQFFAAACFAIAAGIMSLQIYYALNQDLGYSYKNVHQFHFQGAMSVDQKITLVTELKKNQKILGVSRMASGISNNSQLILASKIDAPKEKAVGLHTIYIADYEVFNTYEIKIIAGSLPEKQIKQNQPSGDAVICEQSLGTLGFSSAESAVNQKLNLYFSDTQPPTEIRIAAVSKRILPGGLLSTPVNCIFWNVITPEAPVPFSVRYKEGSLQETLKLLKETAMRVAGSEPVDWSLKDEIEGSIKQEKLINQFLQTFLLIILIICLLGIYGVSSLDAQKRKKEIALRKLHGAKRWNIIQLLSKRFLLLILIAHSAAMPVALYFMSRWIKEFSNQIDLILWGSILTLASALAVFLLTNAIVTAHTFKVVSAHPADTLKAE